MQHIANNLLGIKYTEQGDKCNVLYEIFKTDGKTIWIKCTDGQMDLQDIAFTMKYPVSEAIEYFKTGIWLPQFKQAYNIWVEDKNETHNVNTGYFFCFAWSEKEAISVMRQQRPDWNNLQIKNIIKQTN